jgi:hypothetical protein
MTGPESPVTLLLPLLISPRPQWPACAQASSSALSLSSSVNPLPSDCPAQADLGCTHRRALRALDGGRAHTVDRAADSRAPRDRGRVLRRARQDARVALTHIRRCRRGWRHDAPLVAARRPRGQHHVRRREHLCVSLLSSHLALTTGSPVWLRALRVPALRAPRDDRPLRAAAGAPARGHQAGRVPARAARANACAGERASRRQHRAHGCAHPPGVPLVDRAEGPRRGRAARDRDAGASHCCPSFVRKGERPGVRALDCTSCDAHVYILRRCTVYPVTRHQCRALTMSRGKKTRCTMLLIHIWVTAVAWALTPGPSSDLDADRLAATDPPIP